MIRAHHGDPWRINFDVGPMFETLSDTGRFLQTHGRSTLVVVAMRSMTRPLNSKCNYIYFVYTSNSKWTHITSMGPYVLWLELLNWETQGINQGDYGMGERQGWG